MDSGELGGTFYFPGNQRRIGMQFPDFPTSSSFLSDEATEAGAETFEWRK